MTQAAFSNNAENTGMAPTRSQQASKSRVWTGRVLSGIAVLFMTFDGLMKLVQPAPVVKATVQLGYPAGTILGIGEVLLVCTALYAYGRTSVLGAILLTGYLGGAVASNVRAENPAFNVAFPLIFGVIVWAGIWLRQPRLASLIPFRSE